MLLIDLPNEILDLIIQKIDCPYDYFNVMRVNKLLYHLSKRYYMSYKVDLLRLQHKSIYRVCFYDWIAKNGHLDAIEWLDKNKSNSKCTYNAMNGAAKNGHLEVVEYLHHNRNKGCTTDAMDLAAMNGHLEVVKWLHNNRNEGFTSYAMNHAAMNGHLEIVKWLHNNRKEGCTKWAMNYAADGGHLEIVKWFYKERERKGVVVLLLNEDK